MHTKIEVAISTGQKGNTTSWTVEIEVYENNQIAWEDVLTGELQGPNPFRASLYGLLAFFKWYTSGDWPRMEPEYRIIYVQTDVNYLFKGMVRWVYRWAKRGWITQDGSVIKNKDLWTDIYRYLISHPLREFLHPQWTGDPEEISEILTSPGAWTYFIEGPKERER